jgi:DNA-binding GntR family transcriptional regulator
MASVSVFASIQFAAHHHVHLLSRQAALTLTQQLAERLAERIRTRLLPAGARLPSVRECARQQGVSPYTVVAAYDLLQAQGLVEARPQRGFFVRDIVQNPLQSRKVKRS